MLFILALTLFSGQGYRSVWRELARNGADTGATPSSDATMLDVEDSDANTAAFITSRKRRGAQVACPSR